MAALNSQISALLSLGADAMDNLFDVHITLPTSISDALTDDNTPGMKADPITPLALRCQGFDPPHFSLKTYDVRYKTVGIKRPAARIEGERIFKLQFRLDAYYNVYRVLLTWRSLVMQPSTGFAATSIADYQTQSPGSVVVYAIDAPISQKTGKGYNADGESRGHTLAFPGGDYDLAAANAGADFGWSFQDVWLTDLEEPKFKTGSGEVQLVTATFAFGEYLDPQMIDAGGKREILKAE